MKNERGLMNYRKLVYFSENKIMIHFKDLKEIWYNGLILDLSESKLTMVIKERLRGSLPILLEDIKTDSIVEFTEKGE